MDPGDAKLVAALRAGDEDAFRRLVDEWHSMMVRVAQIFVPSRAVAEDVVQETWLRVLGALDRFEGRSSLRTWVFRILVNTAKTRAEREGRIVPFSALDDPGRIPEPAVDPAARLARGAAARRRDAGRDRSSHRRAAGSAARGDHAARRRRLGFR